MALTLGIIFTVIGATCLIVGFSIKGISILFKK
jgi:hypothetical protein